MTPRSLALAAVLLFAAPALAGCIQGAAEDAADRARAGATGDGSFTPVDVTASLDVARSAAREWNGNATLHAAFATEGVPVDLEDPPFLFDSSADPHPGDGLAGAWTFIFGASGEDDAFVVAVSGDDTAPTYARALTLPPYLPQSGGYGEEHSRPVETFVASADAALAVASNATVQAWTEDHPLSGVRLLLAHDDEGPAWHVTRFTSSGFLLVARVDAADARLTDLARYPDDWLAPCPDCGPERPKDPTTPPPTPETQVIERTVTLTPFDTYAEMLVPVADMDLWKVNVTVTAEVPGEDPLEARTLRLIDPTWWTVDETTGTGTLTVSAREVDAYPWSGEFLVELAAEDAPVVRDQEVTLTAVVEYGEFLGYDRSVWADIFGGHVGFRQTEDHPVNVEENAEELRVDVQVYENPGPFSALGHGDVSFTLLGPDGTALGSVENGGEMRVAPAAAGVYTLRAVSGDGNVFGTSYEARVTYVVDWSHEDPSAAESSP